MSEYERHRSQVDEYLAGRGFDPDTVTARRFGFVHSPARPEDEYMGGRLVIPYIGPRGNVYQIRFRCLESHDHKDKSVGCPKYLSATNVSTRLYNVGAVLRATDRIALVEGEIDADSVEMAGLPCVGVPGVDSWKPHHVRLFDGIETLVIGDNDEAGQKFVNKVLNGDSNKGIRPVTSARAVTLDPRFNDLNEILQREGVEGVRTQLGID